MLVSTVIKYHWLLSESGLLKSEPTHRHHMWSRIQQAWATATKMRWDLKHKWVDLYAVVWHKLGELQKVPLGPGSVLSSGSHPWSRQ